MAGKYNSFLEEIKTYVGHEIVLSEKCWVSESEAYSVGKGCVTKMNKAKDFYGVSSSSSSRFLLRKKWPQPTHNMQNGARPLGRE